MVRKVIWIGHEIWLHVDDLGYDMGWFKLNERELVEAENVIDEYAKGKSVPTDHYDNWNIRMEVLEDRRFKIIARQLEGG